MANTPEYSNRTLDTFKSKLVGGGARPNLFECEIAFPDGLGIIADEDYNFMIKAAMFHLGEEILKLLEIEHSILGR
jgi:hypothetical protein